MAPETRKITHVLFDMDGLLLDTENFYSIVQQKILDRWGKKFTWDLKLKMMGKKGLEACTVLVDELELHDVTTPEAYKEEREAALDELFPTTPLMPGVDRLVRHLHRHNIPICVATSSNERHLDLKTTLHKELFSLFHHVINGDMVSKGKPDPEIFLKAAKVWEPVPAPENCLVFEDAPVGVAAGKAAGMWVVAVPDPNVDREKVAVADEVLTSLELFKPEAWGLPPFEE